MNDLDLLREATQAGAAAPQALPFSSYRSPTVFEAEMAAWHRDWVAVCSTAEVPAGTAFPTTVGLEPVVIMHGSDGTLRALSNACSHRGTLLVAEPVEAKRLKCPYHAWTYNHTGKLIAVPFDDDQRVDKDAHCLPEFSVDVWNGVVFVAIAPTETLAERLRGVDTWIEPYGAERYVHSSDAVDRDTTVWNANWKFVLENAMESYHLFQVHPKTLEPYTPTRGSFYLAGSARWTATAGTYAGEEPREPDAADFAATHYTLLSIAPSLVGVFTAEDWSFLIVEPVSADTSKVRGGVWYPAKPSNRSVKSQESMANAFLKEDQWICERNQRGIAARHHDSGQLTSMERIVGDFHQWLGWRVFGDEPEAGQIL